MVLKSDFSDTTSDLEISDLMDLVNRSWELASFSGLSIQEIQEEFFAAVHHITERKEKKLLMIKVKENRSNEKKRPEKKEVEREVKCRYARAFNHAKKRLLYTSRSRRDR